MHNNQRSSLALGSMSSMRDTTMGGVETFLTERSDTESSQLSFSKKLISICEGCMEVKGLVAKIIAFWQKYLAVLDSQRFTFPKDKVTEI